MVVLTAKVVSAEDPVYFADPNLKAAVEEALGITDPNATDMLSLTYLEAPTKAITDLTGLEYAVNIAILRLHNNQISDISAIAGLAQLTELNLDYNRLISDLTPLSGLTNLTVLYLAANVIEDLSPLTGLTNLAYLRLYNNNISDVSALSGMTDLTNLSLQNNNLSDVSPLSGLINLQYLGLNDNEITDVSSLSGLVNLNRLDLYKNEVNDIYALSGLVNLTTLYLWNNNISDVSIISGLSNLIELRLQNNQISDISALSELSQLSQLNLENNPLNSQAYCTYIPLIQANNPGMEMNYDPAPPTLDCNGLNYYVDGLNGSDDNDGLTLATAFATIQKGVDEANDGNTILVYPCVYNEELDFLGKAITVRSAEDAAVISAPQGYAALFLSGEDANTVFENFVITGSDGALLFVGSSPTLNHLTVADNNIGAVADEFSLPTISNSIFWNNRYGDLFGCQARYSCLEDENPGPGNIGSDPYFVDPSGGNYHLLSERGRYRATTDEWLLDGVTSPCIDAGDPTVEPANERMPNGGRINMGAYGNTAYASMSEWGIRGDLDYSGNVDFRDLALWALDWVDAFEWAE